MIAECPLRYIQWTHSSRMAATRIRSLDGLRAIAIVLVMLHHSPAMKAYSGAPRYGWIGVDLFFVLSGYLITGILVEARDDSNYYRNFYARRALRIWPLYFAVLVAITAVMPQVVHSEHLNVGLAPWYYFLLLQNLFFTDAAVPVSHLVARGGRAVLSDL